MRYRYKRECFWGDWKNNRTIWAGIVVLFLALLLLKDAKPVALLMTIVGLLPLTLGIRDAVRRLNDNAKWHNTMMEKGYRSVGKIVDAGGKFTSETHYTGHRDKNNSRTRIHHFTSNWWIDVEYYSEEHGIYKRFRCQPMNKSGKLHRMVGKEVEVYTYNDFVYVRVTD